jgi:hypothetical protein
MEMYAPQLKRIPGTMRRFSLYRTSAVAQMAQNVSDDNRLSDLKGEKIENVK